MCIQSQKKVVGPCQKSSKVKIFYLYSSPAFVYTADTMLFSPADLFDSIPAEPSPAPGTPGSPAPGSAMSPGVPPRPMYTGPPPGFASPNGVGMPAPPTPSNQQAFVPPTMAHAAPPRGPIQPPVSIGGGEEAFFQLLSEKKVDQSWTWEQTMREIITEPLYKSLATLAERKAAFSKFIQNIKQEEESNRKERAKEIEPSIRIQIQPLIDNGQIKSWLSYEGMLCRHSDQTTWKALEQIGLNEARELWATIRREIRDRETGKTREIRHRNMDLLMSILKTFEADVSTRWKDANQTVLESQEWKEDKYLQSMDMSDMLAVFDEHIKTIEKEKAQELKDNGQKRKRQDRQMRDWFRKMLQQGKAEGWLHAKTDFSEVYDRFRGHENFVKMLGQPGSSALDLFFDAIDELESELRVSVRAVEHLFTKEGLYRVQESTQWNDFQATLQKALENNSTLQLDERTQKAVFEELQKISKEESRRVERKLRHLSEDLRYALKKVAHHQPELYENEEELSKPWEQVRDRLQGLRLPEWTAFEETTLPIDKERLEEARRGAWERFIKRQREKMEERKAREKEMMRLDEASDSRRKRGEEVEEDDTRRRSSRRAGKLDEEDSSRTRSGASRRERRAGEPGEIKERDRKERRRSATGEDFEAIKVSLL